MAILRALHEAHPDRAVLATRPAPELIATLRARSTA